MLFFLNFNDIFLSRILKICEIFSKIENKCLKNVNLSNEIPL